MPSNKRASAREIAAAVIAGSAFVAGASEVAAAGPMPWWEPLAVAAIVLPVLALLVVLRLVIKADRSEPEGWAHLDLAGYIDFLARVEDRRVTVEAARSASDARHTYRAGQLAHVTQSPDGLLTLTDAGRDYLHAGGA